jgi:DNA-binding MarR family transcriptional regulator
MLPVPAAERDDAVQDFVDVLLASWAQNRADLDVRPVAVTTRLARVRDHFEGEMAAVLGSYDLSTSSFVMLVTLVRLSGTGSPVSEARIAAELGLTEATITIRMERLVEHGLVERHADGTVTLTPAGREHAEEVVRAHLSNQARLLSPLSEEEQATLAGLLRRLLLAIEGPRNAAS